MRQIYLVFIFVAIHAVLCRPTEDNTSPSASDLEAIPPENAAHPEPAKVHHKKSKKPHKTTTVQTPTEFTADEVSTTAPIVGIGYHGDLPEMALVEQTGLDLKSKVLHAISEAHAIAQKARADIHRGLIEVKMGHDNLDQKARQVAHDALHYHQPYYYPHTFPLLHHMYRREVALDDEILDSPDEGATDLEVKEAVVEVFPNSQEMVDEVSKDPQIEEERVVSNSQDEEKNDIQGNGLETDESQDGGNVENQMFKENGLEGSPNSHGGIDGDAAATNEGDEGFDFGVLGLPQPAIFENAPTDEEEEEARNSLQHMGQLDAEVETFGSDLEGEETTTASINEDATAEAKVGLESQDNNFSVIEGEDATHQVRQRDAGSKDEEATIEESKEVEPPQVLGRFGSDSEESFEEDEDDEEDKSLETRFGDDDKGPLLGFSIPRVAEAKEAAMKLVSDAKEWALRAREDLQSRLEELHDNAFGKSRSSLDNLLEDVRSKYVFPRSRLGDLDFFGRKKDWGSFFPRRIRRDSEDSNRIDESNIDADEKFEVSNQLDDLEEKSSRRRSNSELVGSGYPFLDADIKQHLADVSLAKDLASWDLRKFITDHDLNSLGLQAKMDLNRYLKEAEVKSALTKARLAKYHPLSWKLLWRRGATSDDHVEGSLEIVVEAEPKLQKIEDEDTSSDVNSLPEKKVTKIEEEDSSDGSSKIVVENTSTSNLSDKKLKPKDEDTSKSGVDANSPAEKKLNELLASKEGPQKRARLPRHFVGDAPREETRREKRHIQGEAPDQEFEDASEQQGEDEDEGPVVGLGFPITKAIVAGTKLKAATRAAMVKARFGLKKRLAHAKINHALTKARLAYNPFFHPHFLLRSGAPGEAENFSGEPAEESRSSEVGPDMEPGFPRQTLEEDVEFRASEMQPNLMERNFNDLENSFGEGHMGEFGHSIAPRQVMFAEPRQTRWSHRKQDEELFVWSLNNFASRQHPEGAMMQDYYPERTLMQDHYCDTAEAPAENEKARHFHHQPLFGGKKLFPFHHGLDQPSHVTINNQQNTFNNALPQHGTANIQISQTTSSTASSQGGLIRSAGVATIDAVDQQGGPQLPEHVEMIPFEDDDAIVSSPNLFKFHRNRPTYRRRRSLPLVRLMVDPNSKLDMSKTMQNVGTIARNSFEDQKAPMYHVRNMAGSIKNAFLSTLKMAPQDLVVPSQYKIVDTKEDVVMRPNEVEAIRRKPIVVEAKPKTLRERLAKFIIERESRHLKPRVDEARLRQAAFAPPPPKMEQRLGSPQQGDAEEDPFNFLGTFQKVGTILRDSIRSGREAMQHVTDAAHSARKAFSTAKFAGPRVLTSYSRAPVLQKKPSKLMMISPRFLDVKEDDNAPVPAELRPDFVGVGDLMNAFGVSDAEAQKVGLRRYTIQRNPDPSPILQSRFGGDDAPQTPQNKYYIIAEDIDDEGNVEDTWKSIQRTVGVDSIKDFIGEMRQDFDYLKVQSRQSSEADPELRSFLEDLFEEKATEEGNAIKKEVEEKPDEKARMKFPEKLEEPFMGMVEVEDEEQEQSYEDYGQPFDSYYDNIKFEND